MKEGSGLISVGSKGGSLPGMLLIIDETMMDVYSDVDYIVRSFENSYKEIQLA